VWETSLGDSSTESHSIVEHLAVGRLTGSITFVERLLLYGGLSFVAIQEEGDGATPAGAMSADGPGLGDAWIGLRARLLGTGNDVFMLAAQLGTTVPLADASNADQNYRGEGQWTIDPKIVGQFNLGPARLLVNVGVRARPGQDESAPGFGHELTVGAGAGVWLAKKRVMLAGEVLSAFAFEDFGGREATSIEMLAGVKYFSRLGVTAGLGLGTGLARGVGSPDVRALAMLGWAPSCEKAPPPKPACDADADKDGVCSPCVAAQGRQAEFASVCKGDDQCPDQAEDKDAFEDADGCPDPDNDKDGILDAADDCPLEPEDKDGFVDGDGCPEDGPLPAVQPFGRLSDDDSTEPLKTVRIGCKEIKADWSVFFETGKAEIMAQSKTDLDQVVETLTATPDIRKVRVEGHTDSKGNPKSNLKLSDARAQAVRDYLVSRGIDAARLESKGYGQTKPVASNKTEEGRAKNRRVVFAIVHRDKACDKDVPPGCEEFTFRGHVNFETASAKLKATSFPTLDRLADLLREARFAKLIEVSGHTDAAGKRDYNRKLSADRAISVREYLVGKGVDAAVLKALGYGYDRPIADNATVEGRFQNRRVEFVVLEKADACVPKAK